MKERSSTIAMAAVLGFALALIPASGMAQLEKDQQKCLTALNKFGAKLAKTQGKENRKCVKDAGKGKKLAPGEYEDCLTADRKGKIAKTIAKLQAQAEKKCLAEASQVPPFGIPGGTANIANVANAIALAAVNQELQLVDDLFGNLDASLVPCDISKDDCKCQAAISKDAEKLADKITKEFVKCKKSILKDGALSLDEIEACLTSELLEGSVQADSKGKIAKTAGKIQADIDKRCGSQSLIPGCADFPLATQGTCVERIVRCRMCRLIKKIDAMSSDVDCDLFDDDVGNSSCGLTQHSCTLDGASQLDIYSQALPVLSFTSSGVIDIGADTNEFDMLTGISGATCTVDQFDPIDIPGIGTVCLTSAPGCPVGQVDCDGGSPLDIDVVSLGDEGACAGNILCEATCTTSCASLGKVVASAGCTGFCTEGTQQACNSDAFCNLAGEGTCNGPDPVDANANICQCQCVDQAFGSPSPAGTLSCNLGATINVETAPPCDGLDIFIPVGAACIPLTTGNVSSQILDANFSGGTVPGVPATTTGAAISCNDLETGNLTGLQLVGATNFFGSALGDLVSVVSSTCE